MTEAITTISGKFYAGMTREVAEEQGLVKSTFWQRGTELVTQTVTVFDDIDINKNGILEDTEICFERDREI